MKNTLLVSCFLFLFSIGCAGPTGFLIDESQKSTLKNIDKLLLVIELKSSHYEAARRYHYQELKLKFVKKYAKSILEKASGLEVDYTDNKKTDKSFVLIKMKSRPICAIYTIGYYKCPGGRVEGNISLYQKGGKIFYEKFFHKELIKRSYKGIAPNHGEELALLRSEGFKDILNKIGSELRKYSSN